MAVIRDSGMPDEEYWESLFNIEEILDAFEVGPDINNVVDFGAGYGTFTLPAAARISGVIYALDIDAVPLSRLFQKSLKFEIKNIIPRCLDFIECGTGCDESSTDLALQFNILHCEKPEVLLEEAFRILRPGGRLAVIHWNADCKTPRGPDLSIRPTPEKCIEWATRCGFLHSAGDIYDLKPWHFGLSFSKPEIKHKLNAI